MADDTLLTISGFLVAPYSARGLKETLEPIAASVVPRRTVDGTLVNLAASQFQKYKLTISCTDVEPPAFSGLWPGQILTIGCVTEFRFITGVGSAERPVVPFSSRLEGAWTFYRPSLTIMVVAPWSQTTDEYGAFVEWQLPCEEV